MKSTLSLLLAVAALVTSLSAHAAPQDHIQGPYEGMKISEANLTVGLAIKLKAMAQLRSEKPLDATYTVKIEDVSSKFIQSFVTNLAPFGVAVKIYEMKVLVTSRTSQPQGSQSVRLDCEIGLFNTTRADDIDDQTDYPPVRVYCEDRANKRTMPTIFFDVPETENLIGVSPFEFFNR